MASATMTATPVKGAAGDTGTLAERFYDLTFSGTTDTYVTGGFTIDPHSVGLLIVLGLEVLSFSLAAGTARTTTWFPQFDIATGKIQLFTAAASTATTAALAEAANSVQVSTFVIRVRIIGY